MKFQGFEKPEKTTETDLGHLRNIRWKLQYAEPRKRFPMVFICSGRSGNGVVRKFIKSESDNTEDLEELRNRKVEESDNPFSRRMVIFGYMNIDKTS